MIILYQRLHIYRVLQEFQRVDTQKETQAVTEHLICGLGDCKGRRVLKRESIFNCDQKKFQTCFSQFQHRLSTVSKQCQQGSTQFQTCLDKFQARFESVSYNFKPGQQYCKQFQTCFKEVSSTSQQTSAYFGIRLNTFQIRFKQVSNIFQTRFKRSQHVSKHFRTRLKQSQAQFSKCLTPFRICSNTRLKTVSAKFINVSNRTVSTCAKQFQRRFKHVSTHFPTRFNIVSNSFKTVSTTSQTAATLSKHGLNMF